MTGPTGRSSLCLLLLLGPLSACQRAEPPAAPVAAPPVTVAAVEPFDLEERIEASGQLLARAEASVAAQVAGQVTEILADEGAPVEEGDVVVEIDPERRELELARQRAQMAEARAQLEERRRELARIQSLHRQGVASDARLDAARTALALARSRYDSARANLALAERALRDSSVRAPFSGFISRRHANEGEFVAPGTPLFDLVALDPIEVEFHLAERDSGRVEVGDPVAVRVDPFPGEVFRGKVTHVAPTIDPRTRTLRVKGLLANPEGRLRPGLFARVDLGLSVRRGVAMVPEEAVLERADGSVVFRLVGGNRVERRRVRTGERREGFVEIREGLELGDRVVVRGNAELVDGARVALVEVGPQTRVGSTPAPPAPVAAGTAARLDAGEAAAR